MHLCFYIIKPIFNLDTCIQNYISHIYNINNSIHIYNIIRVYGPINIFIFVKKYIFAGDISDIINVDKTKKLTSKICITAANSIYLYGNWNAINPTSPLSKQRSKIEFQSLSSLK